MKHYYLILSAISLVLISWFTVVQASAESTIAPQAACSGGLLINEIDYAQPTIDNKEFIEIKGDSRYALTDYEIHFYTGLEAAPYRNISLATSTLSRAGYLVVGSNAVSMPNFAARLSVEQVDFVENGEPGGVGLFSVAENRYCAFINYSGTVAGFEDWLNIGVDNSHDGIERGCVRSTSGWWSCNKQTTPGGSNDVVVVQLSSIDATHSTPAIAILAIFFVGLGSTAQIVHPAWFAARRKA